MKIRQVGAEVLYEAGRTDRHNEANGRFSQFSERAYEFFRNFDKCNILLWPGARETIPNTNPPWKFHISDTRVH